MIAAIIYIIYCNFCFRSRSLGSRLRCQFRAAYCNRRMVRERRNQRQRGKCNKLLRFINTHKKGRVTTKSLLFN